MCHVETLYGDKLLLQRNLIACSFFMKSEHLPTVLQTWKLKPFWKCARSHWELFRGVHSLATPYSWAFSSQNKRGSVIRQEERWKVSALMISRSLTIQCSRWLRWAYQIYKRLLKARWHWHTLKFDESIPGLSSLNSYILQVKLSINQMVHSSLLYEPFGIKHL